MVRDNRVKTYTFGPGSLTADANGRFSIHTDHPINGTIQKLFWDAGNHTATGSLQVFISGVGETMLSLISGTAFGNVGGDIIKYIRTNVSSTTGSLVTFADAGASFVTNDIIRVVGSGLGAGTSGLGFTIYYI